MIIWVSPEIRPEHRNALEWLNDATLGNLDFFGVELEVLQIEGSDLKAPNFKVVVGPKAEPVKNIGNALHPPDAPNELGKSYQGALSVAAEQDQGTPTWHNRPGTRWVQKLDMVYIR